jgi:hypothetical protein
MIYPHRFKPNIRDKWGTRWKDNYTPSSITWMGTNSDHGLITNVTNFDRQTIRLNTKHIGRYEPPPTIPSLPSNQYRYYIRFDYLTKHSYKKNYLAMVNLNLEPINAHSGGYKYRHIKIPKLNFTKEILSFDRGNSKNITIHKIWMNTTDGTLILKPQDGRNMTVDIFS